MCVLMPIFKCIHNLCTHGAVRDFESSSNH